jgi:hypothetical protein
MWFIVQVFYETTAELHELLCSSEWKMSYQMGPILSRYRATAEPIQFTK